MLVQAFSHPSLGDKASTSHKLSGKSSSFLESVVNSLILEANTLFPQFLLIFENFNYNFHNFLVNSDASMKVIPLYVAKKVNAK